MKIVWIVCALIQFFAAFAVYMTWVPTSRNWEALLWFLLALNTLQGVFGAGK